MPWILLLLLSLFCSSTLAVTIPGVTSGTAATQQTTPAPEPNVEQKKAAYSALADVLENDTSRQELIGQLRKVAATPPQEPVPVITPPLVQEQKTVLENVTDVSRHYGDALSSRFAQLYRNLIGSPHKPFNSQTFLTAVSPFFDARRDRICLLLVSTPVCMAALSQNGPVGTQEKSREK